MAYFDYLPTEVVTLILKTLHQHHHAGHSHACRVQKQLVGYVTVNKQFYAFFSPLIWSDPVLLIESQADAFLNSMTASYPSVGRHVTHFKYVFPRSDRILIRVLHHLNNLTILDIANASLLTDLSIQQLPRCCPKLSKLFLSRALITEQSLHVVANQCQHLMGLQLHDCPALTSDIFSALAGSASLKVLDIKVAPLTKKDWLQPNSYNTTTTTITNDDDTRAAHLVRIATRLGQLVHFHLIGAPVSFVRRLLAILAVTRTQAKTASQSQATVVVPYAWPRLTRLVLGDFGGTIGDAQLTPLIQSRPQLLKLGFHGTKMTDTTLEAIARWLPRIQVLHLSGNPRLSSRGVRRLVRRCTRLTQIDLSDCKLWHYQFPEAHDFDGRYLELLNQQAINDIRYCAHSDPGEPHGSDVDDPDGADNGNANYLQNILAYINGNHHHHHYHHMSEEEGDISDEE